MIKTSATISLHSSNFDLYSVYRSFKFNTSSNFGFARVFHDFSPNPPSQSSFKCFSIASSFYSCFNSISHYFFCLLQPPTLQFSTTSFANSTSRSVFLFDEGSVKVLRLRHTAYRLSHTVRTYIRLTRVFHVCLHVCCHVVVHVVILHLV